MVPTASRATPARAIERDREQSTTCDLLGVSRSTLYSLIGQHLLRRVHLGRRALIPAEESLD